MCIERIKRKFPLNGGDNSTSELSRPVYREGTQDLPAVSLPVMKEMPSQAAFSPQSWGSQGSFIEAADLNRDFGDWDPLCGDVIYIPVWGAASAVEIRRCVQQKTRTLYALGCPC